MSVLAGVAGEVKLCLWERKVQNTDQDRLPEYRCLEMMNILGFKLSRTSMCERFSWYCRWGEALNTDQDRLQEYRCLEMMKVCFVQIREVFARFLSVEVSVRKFWGSKDVYFCKRVPSCKVLWWLSLWKIWWILQNLITTSHYFSSTGFAWWPPSAEALEREVLAKDQCRNRLPPGIHVGLEAPRHWTEKF